MGNTFFSPQSKPSSNPYPKDFPEPKWESLRTDPYAYTLAALRIHQILGTDIRVPLEARIYFQKNISAYTKDIDEIYHISTSGTPEEKERASLIIQNMNTTTTIRSFSENVHTLIPSLWVDIWDRSTPVQRTYIFDIPTPSS